jgi:hypothetical protein
MNCRRSRGAKEKTGEAMVAAAKLKLSRGFSRYGKKGGR